MTVDEFMRSKPQQSKWFLDKLRSGSSVSAAVSSPNEKARAVLEWLSERRAPGRYKV